MRHSAPVMHEARSPRTKASVFSRTDRLAIAFTIALSAIAAVVMVNIAVGLLSTDYDQPSVGRWQPEVRATHASG